MVKPGTNMTWSLSQQQVNCKLQFLPALYPYTICIAVLLSALTGSKVYAQLRDNAQEVWPSADVYYRINQKFRLYGTVAATKMDESSYSDGAIGLFVDYFTYPLTKIKIFRPNHADSLPGKFLWLRGGYQYSATPPSSKDPFKENMLVTEANARYYLPFEILLTWKNRFDWRINNGEFSTRYRPRLVLERDLHTEYLFFTATGFVEYFANFGNGTVNRLKTQLGFELRVTKKINYEMFWNHQFPNDPEIPEVDAFGMTFKLYLDKQEFKHKKKDKQQKEKKQ